MQGSYRSTALSLSTPVRLSAKPMGFADRLCHANDIRSRRDELKTLEAIPLYWRSISKRGQQYAPGYNHAYASCYRSEFHFCKKCKSDCAREQRGEIQNCDSGVSTSDHGAYLRHLLNECASGNMSSNVALFHMFSHASTPETAKQALDLAISEASGIKRLRLLGAKELWEETPNAFVLVKSVIQVYSTAVSSTDAGSRLSRIRTAYDEISQLSALGSVALYSLGRNDLLEKTTNEVVDYMRKEELLGNGKSALEIGCGTGRFLAAMAPELLSITGIDISENMLKAAADRCRTIANVDLIHGDGRVFGSLPREQFDLIVAIDSFPYLFEAGEEILIGNIKEIKRVLRVGGRLLICNFSYRSSDGGDDRRDIARIADEYGFEILRAGYRPFHYWDGVIFDLKSVL